MSIRKAGYLDGQSVAAMKGVKIVGKRYWVPHVHSKPRMGYAANDGWIPVLGNFTGDDDDGVFAPAPHWHIDFRFMPPHAFACWMDKLDTSYIFIGTNVSDISLHGPTMKRATCYRETPEWPREKILPIPGTTYGLDALFSGQCLMNGRCPHKGIKAVDMHRKGNVLTCPGHGLRFDASTGKVIA